MGGVTREGEGSAEWEGREEAVRRRRREREGRFLCFHALYLAVRLPWCAEETAKTLAYSMFVLRSDKGLEGSRGVRK